MVTDGYRGHQSLSLGLMGKEATPPSQELTDPEAMPYSVELIQEEIEHRRDMQSQRKLIQ